MTHSPVSASSGFLRLEPAWPSLPTSCTMLAASPLWVAYFRREMRYTRINDALAAIDGKPLQAHLGRDVRRPALSLSSCATSCAVL